MGEGQDAAGQVYPGIGVFAGEGQRAGAGLGQLTRAGDDARKGQIMAGGVDGSAGGENGQADIGGAGRAEGQGAPVENRNDGPALQLVDAVGRAGVDGGRRRRWRLCCGRAAAAAGLDGRGDVGAEDIAIDQGDLGAIQQGADVETQADGIVTIADIGPGQIGRRGRRPAGDRGIVGRRIVGVEADDVLRGQRLGIDKIGFRHAGGASEVVGRAGISGGGYRIRIGEARKRQVGEVGQGLDRRADVQLLTIVIEPVVMGDVEQSPICPGPDGAVIVGHAVMGDTVIARQDPADGRGPEVGIVVGGGEGRTRRAADREPFEGRARRQIVIGGIEGPGSSPVIEDAR